jgi:hypothetical protein
VQELVAQLLWFGQGMLARQEEGAGPGEQVDADQGELEPRGVDGELESVSPISMPPLILQSCRPQRGFFRT